MKTLKNQRFLVPKSFFKTFGELFLVLALVLMSSTLVLAHGDEKDEYLGCSMREQMEEKYGDRNNMYDSMHKEMNEENINEIHKKFKDKKKFIGMHKNNLWRKMMFWR